MYHLYRYNNCKLLWKFFYINIIMIYVGWLWFYWQYSVYHGSCGSNELSYNHWPLIRKRSIINPLGLRHPLTDFVENLMQELVMLWCHPVYRSWVQYDHVVRLGENTKWMLLFVSAFHSRKSYCTSDLDEWRKKCVLFAQGCADKSWSNVALRLLVNVSNWGKDYVHYNSLLV